MSMAFLSVPMMFFLIFIAPLWLWLHYRNKRHQAQALAYEDVEKLDELAQRAQVLQQRVETLERLLDLEAPRWRQK